MVGFIGGPKKALSSMKKTFPALAAAQQTKKPVGPAKPVGGGFKPKMPTVPAKMPTTGGAVRRPNMSKVQKPVGPARPVGAITGPTRSGGMAKMPTIGSAARGPDMGRVQKPMMKKGGAVKKAAAKK